MRVVGFSAKVNGHDELNFESVSNLDESASWDMVVLLSSKLNDCCQTLAVTLDAVL